MNAEEPRHGEQRNHRIEHETRTDVFELEDGAQAKITYSAGCRSVSERWCDTCKAWRRVEGVLGPLLGCQGCGRSWL